jgi:mannosyl-3-phosphoglycerate phosphatase
LECGCYGAAVFWNTAARHHKGAYLMRRVLSRRFPVIFTDLDGTLLDNSTYSFEAAQPALELIRKKKIPLIICSSKTRAEIEKIRKMLGNSDPFISENGGGIFIPKDYFAFPFPFQQEKHDLKVIELGIRYEVVVKSLHRIRKTTGLALKGFSMMEAGEIARLCNLSYEDALLARQREYDEPFTIEGVERESLRSVEKILQDAVREEGLSLTEGGRFFHLTGPNDKGMAVRLLLDLFQCQRGKVSSIALGDSHNDAPMLKVADLSILIQKEDGSFDEIEMVNYLQSEAPGPEGWNRVILKILSFLRPSSQDPCLEDDNSFDLVN